MHFQISITADVDQPVHLTASGLNIFLVCLAPTGPLKLTLLLPPHKPVGAVKVMLTGASDIQPTLVAAHGMDKIIETSVTIMHCCSPVSTFS